MDSAQRRNTIWSSYIQTTAPSSHGMLREALTRCAPILSDGSQGTLLDFFTGSLKSEVHTQDSEIALNGPDSDEMEVDGPSAHPDLDPRFRPSHPARRLVPSYACASIIIAIHRGLRI